jgi:hypothetical protein
MLHQGRRVMSDERLSLHVIGGSQRRKNVPKKRKGKATIGVGRALSANTQLYALRMSTKLVGKYDIERIGLIQRQIPLLTSVLMTILQALEQGPSTLSTMLNSWRERDGKP